MTSIIKDKFWSERICTVTQNTLPSMYNVLHKTGRWEFFDQNWDQANPKIKPHIFWDSDMAKFLEAVCYSLKYTSKDSPRYSQYLTWIDQIVSMAVKLQQPDGYLNSYFTQIKPQDRFKNVAEEHELYCCGHLIEAAVAHYEVTGSKTLIDCLGKYLDLICVIFGPDEDQLHGYPGHQEIELALIKYLKIVPSEKYFKLLNYFIEQRGYNHGEFFDKQSRERGIDPYKYLPIGDYDHLPTNQIMSVVPEPRSYWYFQADDVIRNYTEVKGHAVRQMYYLTAVEGLASLKQDESLHEVVRKLFDNMIDKKFYIHGGIGSVERWEGFGENYELNWNGYSETCASIGLVLLCEKMLEYKLDNKVALAMERALYNNVLGGVGIEGDSYFYNQPITGGSGIVRQKWFSVACCPPNVARLFNSLEKYSLHSTKDSISIHVYIGVEIEQEDYKFKLSTSYPHRGEIEMTIKSIKPIKISLRAPEFKFQCSHTYVHKNGYLYFKEKIWENETIIINFDIPVEVISPDPNVEANVGHLAIKRGPFVYGLQTSGMTKDISLEHVKISKVQTFDEFEDHYNDTKYISLKSIVDGNQLVFVPYFVLGNAHPGEDFRLWFKEV